MCLPIKGMPYNSLGKSKIDRFEKKKKITETFNIITILSFFMAGIP
jgi:hypothetical protein